MLAWGFHMLTIEQKVQPTKRKSLVPPPPAPFLQVPLGVILAIPPFNYPGVLAVLLILRKCMCVCLRSFTSVGFGVWRLMWCLYCEGMDVWTDAWGRSCQDYSY